MCTEKKFALEEPPRFSGLSPDIPICPNIHFVTRIQVEHTSADVDITYTFDDVIPSDWMFPPQGAKIQWVTDYGTTFTAPMRDTCRASPEGNGPDTIMTHIMGIYDSSTLEARFLASDESDKTVPQHPGRMSRVWENRDIDLRVILF